MRKARAVLSWSTGKDAAWSLHALRQSGDVEVAGLLTTIDQTSDRVAMHGVRLDLLERQAKAVGLPLLTVPLPWPCSNTEYEAAMRCALAEAVTRFSITQVAFGDLFLEEVRAYREKLLEGTGLAPLFPLWGRPTRALAKEMIAGGLEAVLTCVNPSLLPASFAGRAFDRELLNSLPEGVDPCGERGEFHTCVTAGPMFSRPLATVGGEIVERDGFVFADLLHGEPPPTENIFDENGALSREFLLNRGTCCGNRCRNCPYDWAAVPKGS